MNQSKPIIGITVSEDDGRLYASLDCEKAVFAAGGLPVLLPIHLEASDAPALLAGCGGILFSGGVDMDPIYYGEEVLDCCGVIDPARDAAETAYYRAARSLKMPILGICRGHQLINVLEGGTLYQDIGVQLPREQPLQHMLKGPTDTPVHSIQITPGSRLETIAGGRPLRVTSTHHQAVRRVAPALTVGGVSADGIVEELEDVHDGFLLSVQWHPERRWQQDASALALFEALVSAAEQFRMEKK